MRTKKNCQTNQYLINILNGENTIIYLFYYKLLVEAAGVEPKYPHGWHGFTSVWATWGPHQELNWLLKQARTSADNSRFFIVNLIEPMD